MTLLVEKATTRCFTEIPRSGSLRSTPKTVTCLTSIASGTTLIRLGSCNGFAKLSSTAKTRVKRYISWLTFLLATPFALQVSHFWIVECRVGSSIQCDRRPVHEQHPRDVFRTHSPGPLLSCTECRRKSGCRCSADCSFSHHVRQWLSKVNVGFPTRIHQ